MSDKSLSKALLWADFISINKLNAPLSLRLQVPKDMNWVSGLHNRVFGPGRFSRAAFVLREQIELDLDLCLVAEINGNRVGSVWMTPVLVSGKPGYLLGPVACDLESRGLGVGGLLVKAVTQMALAKLEKGFVLLVGDASYYEPLGYKKVKPGAIVFPAAVDPERVLVSSNRLAHARELTGIIAGRELV